MTSFLEDNLIKHVKQTLVSGFETFINNAEKVITEAVKPIVEEPVVNEVSDDYDISLRPEDLKLSPTLMDDIVVNNVSCFRAEMIGKKDLWMACYLDNDANQRVQFYIRSRKGSLEVHVTEFPEDNNIVYERGSVINLNGDIQE